MNTTTPWKLIEEKGYHIIKSGNGTDICFMNCQNANINSEEKLILAAPLMAQAMQTFVDRVEKGEVRSKKTYAQFKDILSLI